MASPAGSISKRQRWSGIVLRALVTNRVLSERWYETGTCSKGRFGTYPRRHSRRRYPSYRSSGIDLPRPVLGSSHFHTAKRGTPASCACSTRTPR